MEKQLLVQAWHGDYTRPEQWDPIMVKYEPDERDKVEGHSFYSVFEQVAKYVNNDVHRRLFDDAQQELAELIWDSLEHYDSDTSALTVVARSFGEHSYQKHNPRTGTYQFDLNELVDSCIEERAVGEGEERIVYDDLSIRLDMLDDGGGYASMVPLYKDGMSYPY